MKTYALFPGCSLEKIAQSYHHSALETCREVGVELKELPDWNCCGATAYFHVDELLAHTLCARNLAQAEQLNLDVVAPCAACFKNMYFTNEVLKEDPDLAEHINFALEEANLHFSGKVIVRHLLELLAHDVGPEQIKQRVTHPLAGLHVAAYYGCQTIRPRKPNQTTEDVEQPHFFEDLVAAMGATAVDYPYKLRCCGGSLLITNRRAALSLVRDLLQCAIDRGAAVIATACPMCQVNLECYQQQVNQEFGTDYAVPVMYFTQLLGLALGIAPTRLGVGSELVRATPLMPFVEKLQQEAA
ncbi:MAG: CoB--CoM heterodisulfide reductase iron-sulfur subunit B family protein [Chloroflexota bacterium]